MLVTLSAAVAYVTRRSAEGGKHRWEVVRLEEGGVLFFLASCVEKEIWLPGSGVLHSLNGLLAVPVCELPSPSPFPHTFLF